MYEVVREAAAALTIAQGFLGLAASAVAVNRLGKWSAGSPTALTGLLNLLYLASICALLFFVYACGVNALPP